MEMGVHFSTALLSLHRTFICKGKLNQQPLGYALTHILVTNVMHIPGSNHRTCIQIDLQLISTVHASGLRAYEDILLVLLGMLKVKIHAYIHMKFISV
jgi:hypothetical protein